MSSIATDKYWEQHWQKNDFAIVSSNHPVRKWVERNIKQGNGLSCLEIGCYPGKFLAIFGEQGYRLNGIDKFEGTDTILKKWLHEKGYAVGEILKEDFLDMKSSLELYDVVCSFGFIEHFENWPEIIKHHTQLVKDRGQVTIEVPNFASPLYFWIYKLFEPWVLRESHIERNEFRCY